MGLSIKKEYDRLKKLFDDVDPKKSELVDELIRKAAFLKDELNRLEADVKKYGSIEKSSKGNVRESVYYKTYLQSVNVYQTIVKTLNTILGKSVTLEDDGFDEFMKKLDEN